MRPKHLLVFLGLQDCPVLLNLLLSKRVCPSPSTFCCFQQQHPPFLTTSTCPATLLAAHSSLHPQLLGVRSTSIFTPTICATGDIVITSSPPVSLSSTHSSALLVSVSRDWLAQSALSNNERVPRGVQSGTTNQSLGKSRCRLRCSQNPLADAQATDL